MATELVKDTVAILMIFPAIVAATVTGMFAIYHNMQKSRLDREQQWKIAQFSLMKSAFDIRFREEFEGYKALWPALDTAVGMVKHTETNILGKTREELAALLERDMMPLFEVVHRLEFCLPKEIRTALDDIAMQVSMHHSNLTIFTPATKEIFTQPKSGEEIEVDIEAAKKMIERRLDMLPDVAYDFVASSVPPIEAKKSRFKLLGGKL